MKKSNFKINVWDLLKSAGKIDQFSFEKENIEELNSLSKDWISGDVIIQSFDQNSLLVTLEELDFTIHEECDICWKKYDRKIKLPEYSAKFQSKISQEEEWDDEIFKVDWSENIDIKEMVLQAVILQEPFSKVCPKCKEKKELKDDNIDDFDYMEWTWNITFS